MEKEKQKENCEKIKEDKSKREFIKKSLLGLGTAGIVVGVLASPLAISVNQISTSSLSATSTVRVTNWNTDYLDGYHGSWYRCADNCSWNCNTTCSSACTGKCLGTCTGCSGGCTGCSGANQ